ncbi:MAG: hypothetical protein K2J32_11110 [Ruminococcus sp.]|nr:hypothetical protein [Ruminococcus sp.]
MKIVVLENVECKYDGNKGFFTISWKGEGLRNVQKIVVAEIDISGDLSVKYENFTCIDASKRNKIEYKQRYEGDIHRFIVAGISKLDTSELITPNVFNNLCRQTDIQKITCMGFSGSGTIKWKSSMNEKDNTLSISLQSSFDIPNGFLCYSYKYYGVKFLFRIYKTIPKSKTMNHCVKFYLPLEAIEVNLEMPGTSIIPQKEEQDNNGNIKSFIKKVFLILNKKNKE